MSQDRLYALPRERVGDFQFDESVVDVFPNMIARSVPGYASILSMIEQLTARYVQPDSSLYDLGCSLGAATLLMRRQAPASCVVHAVDSAPAMLAKLRDILAASELESPGCAVRLHEADIRDVAMQNASLIVLNLTLQFIPPEDRTAVIQHAHDALLPGGAILVSEKICFDRFDEQQLLTDLHHDFKRSHGYSDLEIAQKRTAIENRLIPETMTTHLQRMEQAGFATVAPWFQCFNFASILAVKGESAR